MRIGERYAFEVQIFKCDNGNQDSYVFGYLNSFPANLGDLNEEHGEGLHHDIKVMEERFQGKLDAHDVQLKLEPST